MSDIIKYITDNKIVILLIIILGIIIYFYMYPQKSIEKMDVVSSIPVGSAVYLKYVDSTNQTYYLGMIKSEDCTNFKKDDTNCKEHSADLQVTKDDQTIFILNQLIGQEKSNSYFITSKKNDAKLINRINLRFKPSMNICFGMTHDTDTTSFNITPNTSNTGYNIWVNKKILNKDGSATLLPYYLSNCGETNMCNSQKGNLPIVCLNNDVTKAITFNFEMATGGNVIKYNFPMMEQEQEHEYGQMYHNQEHPNSEEHFTEKFAEPFDNVTNFSLFSQDTMSKCDTMSLPGRGDLSDYASWNDNQSLLN